MQFRASLMLFLAVATAAAIPACSCSGEDEGSSNSSGTGGSGGDGGSDPVASAVRIDPPSVVLEVDFNGPAPTQAYRAFATIDGQEVEVTADCTWSASPGFGLMSGATLTTALRGGEGEVTASCSGASGSSELLLNLSGELIAGGATPGNAPELFEGATPTDDATRAPSMVYPLDGAIAPRNLPPVDMQWLTGQNDLFRIHLAATHLDLDLYTSDVSLMLAEGDWGKVAETVAGEDLTIEVEALLQADPSAKFGAPPVRFRISHDILDKTAIYWWASNQQSLITQTFGATSEPERIIENCTSCHSVSRSGSRIGYSRCVGGDCNNLRVGFMRFDKQTNAWVEVINADTFPAPIFGSYTTFSPVGYPFPTDAQSVALVTRSPGFLEAYDPDTGAVLPSNAPQVSVMGPNGTQRSALMADWSPDGKRVAFASTPYPNAHWIDLSEGAIAVMSYEYDGTNHIFGQPDTIVPSPLELPSGQYNNLFFPSFSPDGEYIVFNAARSAWRNGANAAAPGQRLALADSQGAGVVELAAMNGPGDLDITWSHWAPRSDGEYLWVVFSSQRDYGHKLTLANTDPGCKANGVNQCKQIWIGAIDRQKLAAGLAQDPSAPAVWLPGQNITANNISPYWTVPTTEIPQ
ncbi:TolB family protein [Chondromyces apiculatus]|uniref:TolB protein n=1 Tax=Chondromyces apiculatus DSM 436 TaxID=1192034 RepID=A0A017T0V6_9BACT|nr:PD40 domain-containing protein [Chondromyces apiculatus]EYF02889.1 Hypothetical protein CAP_6469 [Chondromyces apiculatus DSM 436]